MFVRVYDKERKKYYKSMVYGLLNIGYYEQAILFNPYTNSFECVEYFDKEKEDPYPYYECINNRTDDWVFYERTFLLKLKKYCKEHAFEGKLDQFRGYKEVFDNFEFMLQMLQGEKVSLEQAGISLKTNEDIDEWTYIRTQEDANEFMRLFAGFHDSTMDKLTYEEDYGKKQLTAIFDNSCWYGVAELCFEGLIRMNLHGFGENHTREIYEGTLLIQDESVYWADGFLQEEDMNYRGTWIKALNLKWRKID